MIVRKISISQFFLTIMFLTSNSSTNKESAMRMSSCAFVLLMVIEQNLASGVQAVEGKFATPPDAKAKKNNQSPSSE